MEKECVRCGSVIGLRATTHLYSQKEKKGESLQQHDMRANVPGCNTN